jgi:hypothetical protein
MARGSAAKAVTAAKAAQHPPIPATGRARLPKPPKAPEVPLSLRGDAHPLILAVVFEPGRGLGLGQQIGTFDRIDLRDREITKTVAVASKHRGFFSMWLRGPLLVVKYDGPKGKSCVAVPVVGNVRRIEFEPV